MRKRTDGGAVDRKEGICDSIGSFPGESLNTCVRRPEVVSMFSVRRTRLCLRRNALRVNRCPSVFHKDNEESDSGDKGEMGSQSGFSIGLSYSVAPRLHLAEENSRSFFVFLKTMITHQQREMSAETNTEVFVLGVPLKHRRINSSIERGKAFFISRAAETLGEVMYKSQTDSCERLGVSYWEAKHNSFCHSRRIPPSRSYASLAPKECQNSRMERDDEDECISPQGDQRMEEDIEADQESGISFGFHSSSCSDYRCSGTSMGCDIQNQQQFFGLACQFSLICPQPVVQLQRTTSCFASSAPFCLDYPEQQKNSSIASVGQQLSSLQRESLECGEESSASATQDMEMDGGKESDNKSTTSPRHKERQSRCTVPPGKSRGQRDQKRHIQRDTCSVESETDS